MTTAHRSWSTRTLLGLAFVSLLITVAIAGIVIDLQASDVRNLTRLMIEDAHPGVVVAQRLREILPRFHLAEEVSHLSREEGDKAFAEASRHFEGVLKDEETLTTIFVDNLKELREMRTRFARLLADADALRAAHLHGHAGKDLHERLEADIARLEEACHAYARVNERDLRDNEAALRQAARREDLAVRIGVGTLLAFGLAWALMLARAIARPLYQLKRGVSQLPEAENGPLPPFKASLSSLTPLEIRELLVTFQETADLLQQVAEQRRRAQGGLERSLEREHRLNVDLATMNASLDDQVKAKTSELASANERLSELVEQLRERDREKSSFLAAVSHELRTPLAVIKGSALTLSSLGSSLPPDAAQQLLSHAVEEANHLSSLIEDLLDAARMDTGTFRISLAPDVDPVVLINSVTRGLAPQFAGKGITLEVPQGLTLPRLKADADRIRQVLRNLLENAAKYTPSGSTVRLTARRVPADDRPERLELTVQDNGPGIPEELRSRLFLPFVQGPKSEGGGTGLGLAIAKQLVEAHGGQIGLDCPPAGGSLFWLWIPIA